MADSNDGRRRGARFGILATALIAVSILFLLTSVTTVEADETLTVGQFAARHNLRVEDSGSYVVLKGPLVRLRLYPGSNEVVVQGERHTLKARILRNGGEVVIPTRPARFLARELDASRVKVIAKRETFAPSPRNHPQPTLATSTPGHREAKRKARVITPLPTERPKAKPQGRTVDPHWIPKTADRGWKWIVIHHSDDASGNAAKYDRQHREDHGWDSLGYHFVIGNGSLSRDGEIEVGPRWPIQKHGAHARNKELGDNRYNERGIGICMVGDFDAGGTEPSKRQMDELARLTRWLMNRYNIPSSMVVRHCDCCKTQCPGRHFPWHRFTSRLRDVHPIPAEPIAQR